MSSVMTLVPVRQLLPDEKANLEEEIRNLLLNADEWLDAPNDQLGGARPWDLIGTDQEPLLRNLVRAAKYGVTGQ